MYQLPAIVQLFRGHCTSDGFNIGTVGRSVESRLAQAHPGWGRGQEDIAGPDRDREEVVEVQGLAFAPFHLPINFSSWPNFF
jgi:hypothetical protein